jgi:hypothetical protein
MDEARKARGAKAKAALDAFRGDGGIDDELAEIASHDDAMVTIEQLSAASAEPVEHLRNYVLAGVLASDDLGMFELWPSMVAITNRWLGGSGKGEIPDA